MSINNNLLDLDLIAKLSYNFNFNLVESWDGYILIWSTRPPPPPEKYGNTSILKLELKLWNYINYKMYLMN